MTKVDEAFEAYKNVTDEDRKMRSTKIIHNSPLPPKKQKYFDQLLTQQIVSQRNAQSTWMSLRDKLSNEELIELKARLQDGRN